MGGLDLARQGKGSNTTHTNRIFHLPATFIEPSDRPKLESSFLCCQETRSQCDLMKASSTGQLHALQECD